MDISIIYKISGSHFMQLAGLTAGAAVLAGSPAPVLQTSDPAGGEAAAPAGETKVLEAWSRQTVLAEESTRGIIDNYNAQNTLGVRVEFVYIAQTQNSQADEKLL